MRWGYEPLGISTRLVDDQWDLGDVPVRRGGSKTSLFNFRLGSYIETQLLAGILAEGSGNGAGGSRRMCCRRRRRKRCRRRARSAPLDVLAHRNHTETQVEYSIHTPMPLQRSHFGLRSLPAAGSAARSEPPTLRTAGSLRSYQCTKTLHRERRDTRSALTLPAVRCQDDKDNICLSVNALHCRL